MIHFLEGGRCSNQVKPEKVHAKSSEPRRAADRLQVEKSDAFSENDLGLEKARATFSEAFRLVKCFFCFLLFFSPVGFKGNLSSSIC